MLIMDGTPVSMSFNPTIDFHPTNWHSICMATIFAVHINSWTGLAQDDMHMHTHTDFTGKRACTHMHARGHTCIQRVEHDLHYKKCLETKFLYFSGL